MALAIRPGDSIGSLIKLGESLYTLINRFQNLRYKFKIIYSDKSYIETPIVVELPKLGFRLVFENCLKQELMLIEVVDFSFIKLSYRNFNINELKREYSGTEAVEVAEGTRVATDAPASKPTLQQIYNKVFGPTYPGKLVLGKLLYIISYPGISFRFKIQDESLLHKLITMNESNVLSELLNWDKPEDITCETLSIFNGDSWDLFYKDFKQNLLKRCRNFLNSKLALDISKFLIDLSNSTVKCVKDNKEYKIQLGHTTQQEILNILGPPDDYFNKFDSRLLIHKHLNQQKSIESDSNSILKFHNYFGLGLDFLYDLNPDDQRKTGILQKIIIHNGGISESLDFMKWNKCNWEIHTNSEQHDDIIVDSLMYFKEIQPGFFSQSNEQLITPVLLNRNEAEFIDNDLDIINVDEVPAASKLSNLKIQTSADDHKIKTWGQSKLYGGKNCIWEVLESNGCISCVTIY